MKKNSLSVCGKGQKNIFMGLAYFRVFRNSDVTFLQVIDGQDSESEVVFFWPAFHWRKSGQSKTSFFILRLLAVLIELCYRLSRALNPNPQPIFWPRFHWSGMGQSEMSFFILRLLAVLIKLCYRLSRALNPNPQPIFLAEISLIRNGPIRNELSYFKTFGRSD